jgi:hypothetical protein
MLRAILLAVVVLFAAVPAEAGSPSPQRHQQIIRIVFGAYGDQAVKVADCETGGSFSVWASNGQYKGLFQMGSSERARYGHGNNAWAQSRAAKRYFVATGKDWSPWSCKPW